MKKGLENIKSTRRKSRFESLDAFNIINLDFRVKYVDLEL